MTATLPRKPNDCLRCPYSLTCLSGSAEAMALIDRFLCDRCNRQWVRHKRPDGRYNTFRCEENHVGLPNPQPWVCWDCCEQVPWVKAELQKRGYNV